MLGMSVDAVLNELGHCRERVRLRQGDDIDRVPVVADGESAGVLGCGLRLEVVGIVENEWKIVSGTWTWQPPALPGVSVTIACAVRRNPRQSRRLLAIFVRKRSGGLLLARRRRGLHHVI
jgi:hypothetical protein